jgi:3-hydroxy-9,10-secoandrosta-1,3,5(10)-triene-9,17-dione monooxygenase
MTALLAHDRVEDLGPDSLTRLVRPHLEEVRSRGRASDQARQPLDENIALIRSLGLIRALVPRKYGGLEHDVYDWLQALRRLATADMSVGWLAGLAGAHAFVLTKFDQRLQSEVWQDGGPDAFVCSATAVAEGGVGVPVQGGLQLSGRWRFSSGIPAADWLMVLIKVPSGESGQLEDRWAVVPKADIEIADTWHVAGMRGTGSHDAVLSDAFIPAHRISGSAGVFFESAVESQDENPLAVLSMQVVFAIVFAPVALGGAEAAVALHTEQLQKRKAAITGVPLVESPLAQVRLAEATMRLRAVTAIQEDRWRDVAEHVRTATTPNAETQMWWRVTDAYVGRESMRITEHIVDGAGASIYHESNPLQRFWRDLHSASGHTWFNTDSALQILGRELLGLPADPRLI